MKSFLPTLVHTLFPANHDIASRVWTILLLEFRKSTVKALTLRPHWAWFVVNGYKDIENRSWATRLRGRIWIHASSSKVTRREYERVLEICREQRIDDFPKRERFKTGGILGSVEIGDCVAASRSYWFKGPYGFLLKHARKTRFRPMKGRLGFFEVDAPRNVRSAHGTDATPQADDYVAYHSVELMGHDYRPHKRGLRFLSKKPRVFLEKAIGRNVWVITGTREARGSMVYRLAAVHPAHEVRDSVNGHMILGKGGHVLKRPVALNGLSWFRTLFREQNQFSFGFNRIRNARVIKELQSLTSTSS